MRNAIAVFGPALPEHRLLLLAYYFPPRPKGGAPRLGHVAKSLTEFGWEVTVVTPSEYPDEFRIPKDLERATTRARLRRASHQMVGWLKKVSLVKRVARTVFRVLTLPRALFQFPDRTIWWLLPALRDVRRLHRQQRFDAMMTSCSPGASHVIGAIAARLFGIPWVADYQDLWSGSALGTKSPRRRAAERRLEAWALRRASAVTCCKQSFVHKLRPFVHPAKLVRVVPMAVDLSLWDDVPDTDPSEFRLVFVGNMYASHITPDLLFAALQALRDTNDPAGCQATFHYYGHCGDIVRSVAKRYGVEALVHDHGVVSRRSALEAERAAMLLLAIVNPDVRAPKRRWWQPSKLFEYAGARRHILGIAPPQGVVEDFLRDSGLGFFASDQASVAAALQAAHGLFLRRQFRPVLKSAWRYVTPRDVGRSFATVLHKVIAGEQRSASDDAEARPGLATLPSCSASGAMPREPAAHEAAST